MQLNRRIVDMTLAELFAALDERDEQRRQKQQADALPAVVYGIAGVRQIFRCSKSTACRIMRSGRIEGAVSRVSDRKFIINVAKALELCPNV